MTVEQFLINDGNKLEVINKGNFWKRVTNRPALIVSGDKWFDNVTAQAGMGLESFLKYLNIKSI